MGLQPLGSLLGFSRSCSANDRRKAAVPPPSDPDRSPAPALLLLVVSPVDDENEEVGEVGEAESAFPPRSASAILVVRSEEWEVWLGLGA